MIDNELKKKFAAFIKANLPSDSMSEEDIAWIMDECDKGNKPTYDDFVKARRQPKVIESEDICCYNCRNLCKSFDEEPCKNCLIPDERQPFLFRHPHFVDKHPHFEEKETVVHKDDSPWFGPSMMRQEEFKIPDSIKMIIDQNKKPNIVIPQLDGIEKKIKDFAKAEKAAYDALTSNLNCIQSTANTIKSHQINLEKANHAIEDKIDKLAEALESVNSKLDILDQIMHDFRQHQILKNTKCEEAEKDIPERPEPKFKVDDEVQVVNDIFRMTYTIERMYWRDEPAYYRGYWYVLGSSSDKSRRCVCEDLLIPFKQEKNIPSIAKEPPKFKVGDVVKVTNDSKNKDFFVCRIKWSERSKQWNYLISLDLEDISGAFWRMEKWLTKSEDYIEPLFKVGDKVKLKHGKVVYEVYSITYFMHNKKKVYRYKIGHSASTTHYESENRLIKA